MRPATTRTAWLLYAAFIIYGATIPFHFDYVFHDPAAIVQRWQHLPLNPFVSPDTGRRLSTPDIVQNILLFVPFGLLGVGAAGAPSRWTWRRIIGVTVLGAVLSSFVEGLQLLTPNRTPATSDVLTNTGGTLAGGIALRYGGRFALAGLGRLRREGLDVRELRPLAIAAGALFVAFLQPFDVTLEVGTVRSHIKSFVDNPIQFTGFRDEGIILLIAALFAMALASYIWALDEPKAGRKAAVGGIVLVGLLEASQVMIGSRQPGLWDVAVGSAGIAVGSALWTLSGRIQWPLLWQAALVAMTVLGVGLQMLSPFEFTTTYHGFNWFLFLGYYTRTTFETLSHVIELVLAYFPMGFCLVLGSTTPGRATLVAIAIALAIAVPVEWAQGWIVGRYPDISDIALSLAGAWIGCRLARTVS